MPAYVGTKITRVLGNDSADTRTIIPADQSGTILGIYVACDGVLDIVQVQTAAGVALGTIACGVDSTEQIEVPFLVSNGLLVVSGAGVATTFITVIFRPDT
jgi:hypothetical protein